MTREVETRSKEREGNMVRFAVEALGLLRDVLEGKEGEGDQRANEGGDVQQEEKGLVPGDKVADEDVALGALAS